MVEDQEENEIFEEVDDVTTNFMPIPYNETGNAFLQHWMINFKT